MYFARERTDLSPWVSLILVFAMVFAVVAFTPQKAQAQVQIAPDAEATCVYNSGRMQVKANFVGQSNTFIYVWYLDKSRNQWVQVWAEYGTFAAPSGIKPGSSVHARVLMLDRPGNPGWTAGNTAHYTINWRGDRLHFNRYICVA